MSKNLDEELKKAQLEFYKLSIEEIHERRRDRDSNYSNQSDKEGEIISMWNKFLKLNQEKVIKDLIEIFKKKGEIPRLPILAPEVKEYFLDKSIDLDKLSYSTFTSREYAHLFKPEDKIKWDKFEDNLVKAAIELQNSNVNDIIEKFLKKAVKEGLHDVSQAHIKRFAMELKQDLARGSIGLIQNAVSVKLREHWGDNDPKRKRDLTKSIKIEVFKRDNYTCQECGAGKEAKLHVHHKIPHAKGGSDEMSNLVTLCESCNQSIGDRIYHTHKK